MTIANSLVAKLSVAFVAVAMALTLMAPAAQAQSADELQAQIDSLLATIAALQAQLGGTSGGSTTSCPALTQPMTIGSQGMNVTALQNYLIGAGHTIPAGATGYFGTQTQAAVASWQSANMVSPPAGYWGPISLAKYNQICTVTTPGDDDDDDDDSSADLSGGEASLESFDSTSGDDTDLQEGQNDAPVAEFEFDVKDGDVSVNRIDLAFAENANNNAAADDEPWDVFTEIAIWVDGDEIASMDADDEDDWSDDDPNTGQHKLRFSGLDWVVREGETAEFTVVVSVAGNVDDAANEPGWHVFIPNQGIRAVDSMGIQNYIGEDDNQTTVTSYDEEVDFDIDEEGADDELIIRTSSDDPDATVFEVDTGTRSDWMNVLTFDIDTDDSVNDIVVETVVVGVQIGDSGTDNYEDVVNDARITIDGTVFDDVTITNGDSEDATLTFDIDKDLEIDAGDRVEAQLELRFAALTGNYSEGETVTATTTATGWAAEGADDLTVNTDLTGSATGETHTLRSQGVTLAIDSTSETFIENDDTSTTDNEGSFVIKFDVTAFDDDVYFEKTTSRSTTTSNQAANYILEDSSGNEVESAGTSTAALASTADTESSHFVVREGTTETFTLTVEYDPASAGFYQLQLHAVNFNVGSAAAPDTTQTALPATDFETEQLSI